MSEIPQLELPFALDTDALHDFLIRWNALEDEEARLRDEKRLLKEEYADVLPLRGVLTAVKRVRAQRALESHPKEPMARPHLAYLEGLVEQHLDAVAAQVAALEEDARRLVQGDE